MESRGALLLLNGPLILPKPKNNSFDHKRISSASSLRKFLLKATANNGSSSSSLEPPDVTRLAETARISLSPEEVEEFTPKIRQMIDWFGQLQAVDLDSVEPAIRADTEGDNLRDDIPETFEREAIIAAVPSYDEPYIKVPKVLNKE